MRVCARAHECGIFSLPREMHGPDCMRRNAGCCDAPIKRTGARACMLVVRACVWCMATAIHHAPCVITGARKRAPPHSHPAATKNKNARSLVVTSHVHLLVAYKHKPHADAQLLPSDNKRAHAIKLRFNCLRVRARAQLTQHANKMCSHLPVCHAKGPACATNARIIRTISSAHK